MEEFDTSEQKERKELIFDPMSGDFKLIDTEVTYNDEIVIEIQKSIGEW